MKRIILNSVVWLLAASLFVILLNVLRPAQTTGRVPITDEYNAEMAALIQERQQLETELQRLSHEYHAACAAPTSVFIMINSTDEAILREIAEMMDQLKLPAVMGVSNDMLTSWSESDVPAYVKERLAAGWELCLLLEETPPQQMQEQLRALQLNTAAAAYDTPANILSCTPEELKDCGILILIEDRMPAAGTDDGLWHIGSIGNMHGEGIRIYEQHRNTGSALVSVIGDYRADQHYLKENLEGLLELIRTDSQLGFVQCLRLSGAMYYHQQFAQRLAQAEQEWDQQRTVLESQLQAIIERIIDASSVLN